MFIEPIKAQEQKANGLEESTNNDDGSNIASEEIMVGTLAIYVVRDAETWHGGINEGDRYLGINFIGPEWKGLFYDVLNCPRPDPYTNGEDVTESNKRYWLAFQQSIPELPMLARISDMYEDTGYTPKEVEQLRKECLKIEASTDNPRALEGLRKLILACNEALKLGLGLFLVSD